MELGAERGASWSRATTGREETTKPLDSMEMVVQMSMQKIRSCSRLPGCPHSSVSLKVNNWEASVAKCWSNGRMQRHCMVGLVWERCKNSFNMLQRSKSFNNPGCHHIPRPFPSTCTSPLSAGGLGRQVAGDATEHRCDEGHREDHGRADQLHRDVRDHGDAEGQVSWSRRKRKRKRQGTRYRVRT